MSTERKIARTAALLRSGLGLLYRERKAVLSGAFDKLEALSAEKVQLLRDVETMLAQHGTFPDGPGKDELRRIAATLIESAAANGRLLAAARAGATAGREEMEKTNTVNETAGFYGASGKKITPNSSYSGRPSRFY